MLGGLCLHGNVCNIPDGGTTANAFWMEVLNPCLWLQSPSGGFRRRKGSGRVPSPRSGSSSVDGVAGQSCRSGCAFSVLPTGVCPLAGEAQVLPSVREHQNPPGGRCRRRSGQPPQEHQLPQLPAALQHYRELVSCPAFLAHLL